MQVQHELRERAVQARHLPAHHHEARAGDARRGLEIQPAERLAHRHVIARLEARSWRGSPQRRTSRLAALVAPVGHRLVQQVRQSELPALELLLHGGELALGRASSPVSASPRASSGAGILALALGHADGLGVGVALGAQPVRLDLPSGLRFSSSALQRGDIEREAAARQVARHGFGVGAQQLRIDHVVQPFVSLRARSRASASPILISRPRGTGR